MKINRAKICSLLLSLALPLLVAGTSYAVLLVFELKKSDVLYVGDKKIEGGKDRSVEIVPGTYRIKLVTNSKKPVHLPDDDTLYYPEDGKVVIQDRIEVVEDMDKQVIDLTTISDETP